MLTVDDTTHKWNWNVSQDELIVEVLNLEANF